MYGIIQYRRGEETVCCIFVWSLFFRPKTHSICLIHILYMTFGFLCVFRLLFSFARLIVFIPIAIGAIALYVCTCDYSRTLLPQGTWGKSQFWNDLCSCSLSLCHWKIAFLLTWVVMYTHLVLASKSDSCSSPFWFYGVPPVIVSPVILKSTFTPVHLFLGALCDPSKNSG